MRSTVEGLSDLVDKYRLLEALRRSPAGRTGERRGAMRTIAERFPGALREWDEAPLEWLVRRRAEAEAALHDLRASAGGSIGRLDGPDRLWLRLGIKVHRRLRDALAAKRLLGGRPPDDGVAEQARATLGMDRDRLEAISRPPAGRISDLVYREVAREEGISLHELKAALFPATHRNGTGPSGEG